MKIALLRVGSDSGSSSGGIQGPLFKDGSFEYIPIPDNFNGGIDSRTYGNTQGRHGTKLIEYFPPRRQRQMRDKSIHFDPEFDSFTYGDPTPPKAGLRNLLPGDLLVFYCGLEGWDFSSPPGLYLMGYFEVSHAGLAMDFKPNQIKGLFSLNFHAMHKKVFRSQDQRLVLVKGGKGSRLLRTAVKISEIGQDKSGKPLKVLSPKMQKVFGGFGGHIGIQRSPTRWVAEDFVKIAARFVRSLE
jgi:hypothetical protein